MPPAHDGLRLSDADRERAALALRDHAAAGRLDVPQLEERLERAYAAQVGADLTALLADLPAARPTSPARPSARTVVAPSGERWADVATWLFFAVVFVALWAVTGAGYFWPIWPILGWGLGVLPGALGVGGAGHRSAHLRPGGACHRGAGRRTPTQSVG